MPKNIPEIHGNLRKHMVKVPEIIEEVSGIRIFGKLIKSLLFSTDVALIKNCNADAVIAVYPFTPQPAISQAILATSDVPVFCGVGGGTTTGVRVVNLAMFAENQGAIGVVLNAPTKNDILEEVASRIDIPVVITVVSQNDDIGERIKAGASIINVSGAVNTSEIVKNIKRDFPDIPVIATGGPTEKTIEATINAGANAITYTPPTSAEIFKELMIKYRSMGI